MKKITLMLGLVLPFAAFAQDTCLEAGSVTPGTVYTVDAVDGTEIPTPDCSGDQSDTTAAEWYMFTASIDGVATVSSDLPQNAGGDTRVYVYTGSCGSLECHAFNDDVDVANEIYVSYVAFPITAGTTYYIAWDDYWSAAGFDFIVEEITVDCSTALPYATTFDDFNTFAACYAKFDVDANGVSWIQQFLDLDGDGTDETFATNGTNGDDPKNDWLFTPGFMLTGGQAYELTYTFNTADATNPANETLTTYLTDAPSPLATLQQQIATNTDITQQGTFETLLADAYTQTGIFTPAADGEYFIGFNTTSPPNSAFLLLFSYNLTESLATPGFNANKVRVFPNPVATELAIVNQTAIESVEIYNLMGQKVASQSFNSNDVRINVSGLSAGAYTVKIVTAEGTQVSKIVKQ